MIEVLKGCISAQNGEVATSLLFIKNKSTPGIAILRDDVIILIPIFGRRHKVFFNKVKTIEKVKKIAGKSLFNKQIFKIEFEKKPSVAFSVTGTVANKWSGFFQNINQTILNR